MTTINLDPPFMRRTAEAAIRELLERAEPKGRLEEVAHAVVGAALELCRGPKLKSTGCKQSGGESGSDASVAAADLRIGDTAFVVIAGMPDEEHLNQIADALQDAELEVWVITCENRAASWRNELAHCDGVDLSRVVVTSVESFVGQTLSELGAFSSRGNWIKLANLVRIYNDRWVAHGEAPKIRISTM